MISIFLGAPGAGKGTHSLKVCDKLNIPHISTGDIFRENIKNQTELGKTVEDYLKNGQLVPDEITIEIVKERIHEADCKNGFIFDGFPRTTNQAKVLDEMLAAEGKKVDVVINLNVADSVIINRLTQRRVCLTCGATYHLVNIPPKKEGICDKCGNPIIQRADDTEEVIAQRLAAYHAQTEPLIDYYTKAGNLVDVDGTTKPDVCLAEILKAMNV